MKTDSELLTSLALCGVLFPRAAVQSFIDGAEPACRVPDEVPVLGFHKMKCGSVPFGGTYCMMGTADTYNTLWYMLSGRCVQGVVFWQHKKANLLPWRMVQLVGASSHTQKGSRFSLRSGHMPRLQVWSPVRVRTGGSRSMFLSLSLSLSLSFSLFLSL